MSARSGRAGDDESDALGVRALRDYAFIADGRRGALIDSEGSMAWLCFPDWADPAVFAQLLGCRGTYRVTPIGRHVPGGYYEDGTLIWRSRWTTSDAIVECRDALAYPGDPTRAVVLRSIRSMHGPSRVDIELDVATAHGQRSLHEWQLLEGRWVAQGREVSARLSGVPDAAVSPRGTIRLQVDLEPGETRDLVLELVTGAPERWKQPDPAEYWRRTERAWAHAVPTCSQVAARHDVRRALAVVRGMTSPDGATVAAATTSLPERAEAARNYDYRYCWLRDTCYVGHAGASVPGGEAILDGAVQWVTARLLEHGDGTIPAYRTDGRPVPEEEPLPCPGYPGGFDVIGNRVRDQFQLDLFGECLVLLAKAARMGRLDADGWRAAEVAVRVIEDHWQEPDAGIWEIEPALWTQSRLISVAGLKAVASEGGPPLTRRTLQLADRILAEADRHGRAPSGAWGREPGDHRVDASLLLAEVRGAVRPDDPRSIATRLAVARELSKEGFVYRYGHPGKDLGESEGAFLICNFWMSLACAGAGDSVAAVRWFERGRGATGSPGLFSEEFDTEQHQLRGNIPQVFVHALLVEAAAGQPPHDNPEE